VRAKAKKINCPNPKCGKRVSFTATRLKKLSAWPCCGTPIDEESREAVRSQIMVAKTANLFTGNKGGAGARRPAR
jgi:hypothetical protein